MTEPVCMDRTIFVLVIVILVGIALYLYFTSQKDINDLKARLNYCISQNDESKIQTFTSEKKYIPYQNTNDIDPSLSGYDYSSFSINQPDIPFVEPSPFVPIIEDPVMIYDMNNINNPLVYPTARPPTHLFRSMLDNSLFSYPTRGYPDNPAYIGNLIETKLTSDGDKWEDKDKKFDRYYNKKNGSDGSDGDAKDMEKNNNEKYYNPQLPSVLQLMGQQKHPGSPRYDYYVLLPSTGNNPSIKYTVSTQKNEEVYDGDIIKVLNKTYILKKNKSPFEYIS